MATNKKITELTELTEADLSDNDVLAIVDISEDTTHKVRKSTLAAALSGVSQVEATTPIAVNQTTGEVTVSISSTPTFGTVDLTADTSTGDNAAIGYTAAEGLILTGQGSTNDVTIKNDADADVLEIPTGTTNVTVVGSVTAASLAGSGAGLTAGTTPITTLDIDGGTDIGADLTTSDLIIVDDAAGGTNRKAALSRVNTLVQTAGGFPLTALDIDGGTDIGEDIVDADLFIVDNGAGGTNRKTAASRLKTYIGGFTDPMTTRGDVIKRGASAAERLAIGSANTVLTTDGTDPAWSTVTSAMLAGSIADSKLSTISTADKVAGGAIQIDSGTDGTSITIADTDKLLVDDGGATKYVNASQVKSYVGSGAMAVLGTGTFSGSETGITLTGFSTDYDTYLITLSDIKPVQDGKDLRMWLGTSGGLLTTDEYSNLNSNLYEGMNGTTFASASYSNTINQRINLSGMGNDADYGGGGVIWLHFPTDPVGNNMYSGQFSYMSSDDKYYQSYFAGGLDEDYDITQVKIGWQSGEGANGRATLLGIKHA